MSMKVAYQVQVGDINGANFVVNTNWKNVSIDRSVFWDSPPTAQIELDNHRGAARSGFAVGKTVKIYRNGALLFFGVITKPKYYVDAKGQHAAVEALDYYRWKLKTKSTGITEQWNFSKVAPHTLAQAMIGTKFIHQDTFDNTHRISKLSDTAIQNGTLSLVKDASGYKTTGYIQSNQLQNGDWDTMGDIGAATVYVYPATEYYNLAPNPGFENEMTFTDAAVSEGWLVFHTVAGETLEQVTAEHNDGAKSIHMVNSVTSGTLALQMKNWVYGCEGGQTWKASIYVKGSGTIGVRLWESDKNNTKTHTDVTQVATGSWTEVSVTKVLASGTDAVMFDFWSTTSTDNLYVDTAFFGRVPAAADVDVSISRDGGITFTDATIIYDTTDQRWEGTLSSFNDEILVNGTCETGEPTLNGASSDNLLESVLDVTRHHAGSRCLKLTTGSANMLANPGMETGDYTGWTRDAGAGTVEVVAGAKYNGSYGLHINASTASNTGIYQLTGVGTAAEGDVLNISATGKVIGGTRGDIYAWAFNAAGAAISQIGHLDFTSNSWETKRVNTSACPANTSRIRLYAITQSVSEVYFDDIELKKPTSSATDHNYQLGDYTMNGLTPGESYTLSAWVYVPSGQNITLGNIFLAIYEKNAAGTDWAISSSNTPGNYDQWELLTVTRSTAADCSGIMGRLYISQDINFVCVYIDDVSLTQDDKNTLIYKLALNRESATSAPIIDGVEIHATTASDTGLSEGTLEVYIPDAGYDATMDKDFGDTNRDDGLASINKVVGMEPSIDITNGQLSLKTIPVKVSSGTLTLGTHLTTISSEEDLLPTANAIAYTGSGQISDNINFTHRVNLVDDTSIAAYGRIEKCLKGKDMPTTGMVNNRAYNAMQNVKNPPRTIIASLIDPRTTSVVIGHWYTVNDPTGASGVSSEILRLMSESRRVDTSGESCDLTFSTIGYNPDPDAQFNNLIRGMEAFRDTAQAANGDEISSISGNCKNAVPLKLTFYIHEAREVQNIELTANSEKYKDCQASDIVEFAYLAPCQISINGDYQISPIVMCPSFGVQGDKNNPFNVKRLNLTDYYASDYTDKLKPGYNTIYFVPSTVTTDNTNGLLYINATIKVSYAN